MRFTMMNGQINNNNCTKKIYGIRTNGSTAYYYSSEATVKTMVWRSSRLNQKTAVVLNRAFE